MVAPVLHVLAPGWGIGKIYLGLGTVFYLAYTEGFRIRDRERALAASRAKIRELVAARRAAGLMRLEADVRLRRQDWPKPPHSGATAALRHAGDRTFHIRQVDYRNLCIDSLEKIMSNVSKGGGKGTPQGKAEDWQWLLRKLSQAGPVPGRDDELYGHLHEAIDHVDRNAHGDHFYCRLCLGLQSGGSKPVQLVCKHKLCTKCASSIVEAAVAGNVGVPIACPVGCNGCVTPQLVQNIPGLTSPVFDRFKRMHDVKVSLQQSAPHSRNLKDALAEARNGLPKKKISLTGIEETLPAPDFGATAISTQASPHITSLESKGGGDPFNRSLSSPLAKPSAGTPELQDASPERHTKAE